MRTRLLGFVTVSLLLALLILVPTTEAQTNAFGERDPFWRTDARVNMPVTLCHIPPGNPGNAHSIEVGQAAVPAHLAHGDTLGECAGECPPYPAMVPKTGQAECWDAYGVLINCVGTGQDGEYQTGTSVSSRFKDSGDGTVMDNLTGLIWLQDADCFGSRYWIEALLDAKSLAHGSCGLFDASVEGDWRLPNILELESLINRGWRYPALPSDHPFSNVASNAYWSSTSSVLYPNRAWNGWFDQGNVGYQRKTLFSRVWPVRGPE